MEGSGQSHNNGDTPPDQGTSFWLCMTFDLKEYLPIFLAHYKISVKSKRHMFVSIRPNSSSTTIKFGPTATFKIAANFRQRIGHYLCHIVSLCAVIHMARVIT